MSSYVLTAMLVVFGGGYYLGFTAGVSKPQSVTLPVALLPEPAFADLSAYEQQLPEETAPGEFIDVDLPDAPGEGHAAGPEPAAATFDHPAENEERADAQASAEASQREPLQVALLDVQPDVASDAVVSPVAGHASADTDRFAPMKDSASPLNARYTIQTGMFSDESNAERNRVLLEQLEVSAYIEEFTNSSRQSRFNVRFGWYRNKADALAALTCFVDRHGGEGYLVYLKPDAAKAAAE